MDKSLSLVKRGKISSILNIVIRINAIAGFLGFQEIVKSLFRLVIKLYQRYISPYKGFACAYRILHQEQSCSGYFYTCISEQNFSSACMLLQQRLIDCQQAHEILKTKAGYQHQGKSKRRRKQTSGCADNNNGFNCIDLIDLSDLFITCDFVDCDLADCDFDLGGCDF